MTIFLQLKRNNALIAPPLLKQGQLARRHLCYKSRLSRLKTNGHPPSNGALQIKEFLSQGQNTLTRHSTHLVGKHLVSQDSQSVALPRTAKVRMAI